MNRVKFTVTEVVRHSCTVQISDELLEELLSITSEDHLNDWIGDLTCTSTIDDGYFEDADFDVLGEDE